MNESKNLLQIGEIVKSVGVTRRMILNYEQHGLIKPDVKHGENANRYYTVDTLTRIRTIRRLQNLGLSLDEIYAYYDGNTDMRPIIARLEAMRDELDLSIEKLRSRFQSEGEEQIVDMQIPAQTLYCRTVRTTTIQEKMEQLRIIALEAIRLYGTDTGKRMFFIETPIEDDRQVTYCIAVPRGSAGEYICAQPRQRALAVTHHGGYEELPAVRKRILAHAERQGIALRGSCRHIYLEGPPQHQDKSKFITQVALLLAEP